MEKAGTSNSNDQGLCQLCRISLQRYTCPKCAIPYCSVKCYKSESHLECSESFYKECVEKELESQERDPVARRKMMDILKRMQEDNVEFDDDFNEEFLEDKDSANSVDSDDEEDVPDLEHRLKNVDLDDADEIWAVLTDAEKQEFEAKLRNNVKHFLPPWEPWWLNRVDDKMVQKIEDDKTEPDYVAKCPAIVEVPAFNELTKASPYVRCNLLNVLYAYVYTALHFNGDHQNSPKEAVAIFLQLSDNMRLGKVYEDSVSATEAVLKTVLDYPSASESAEVASATKEAVDLIIQGPEKSNPTFYVLAALSDLHGLFVNAKKELSSGRKEPVNREFSKRFGIIDISSDLRKKTLSLCEKKIEYYLSWVKKYHKIEKN